MNAIVKNLRKLAAFSKTLVRDSRGDDLTDASSNISRGAKVVIAGVAATGLGYGIVSQTNSANATADKTQQNIAGAAGAQGGSSQVVAAPFK